MKINEQMVGRVRRWARQPQVGGAAMIRALQAMATSQSHAGTPTHIYLQVGSKAVPLQVGDVIENSNGHVSWTVTGFSLADNTWSCTASTNGQRYCCDLDLLAIDLEKGTKTVRSFQNSSQPPTQSCNKRMADCQRHGNERQFGGYTNHTTGKEVACPHTFGSKACGVGWPQTVAPAVAIVVGMQLKWDLASSETFTVSRISEVTPGVPTDNDIIYLSWPGNKDAAYYGRAVLTNLILNGKTKIVGHTATTTAAGLRPGQTVGEYYGNETPYSGVPPGLPDGYLADAQEDSFMEKMIFGDKPANDCDECYGTGLYKAMGGPCSKGCKTKGSA